MNALITVYRARLDALEALALAVQPITLAMPLDVSDGFALTATEARQLRQAVQAVLAAPHIAPHPKLFEDKEVA